MPLRLIKAITTSTSTAFNSSQIDSESEEERAQVISESESEIKEEEDDITCNNEYLDQDLKELGPDRLDREETDESDIEKEVSEEFQASSFFRQSIIALDDKLTFKLSSKTVDSTPKHSTYINSFNMI